MVSKNNYHIFGNEFGVQVKPELTLVSARVLPPPTVMNSFLLLIGTLTVTISSIDTDIYFVFSSDTMMKLGRHLWFSLRKENG